MPAECRVRPHLKMVRPSGSPLYALSKDSVTLSVQQTYVKLSLSFTFSYYITHITYSHCLVCCNSFHITYILHGESIISIIYFYLWKYLFYRLFILRSDFLIMSVRLANCTWGCAQSYIPDNNFFFLNTYLLNLMQQLLYGLNYLNADLKGKVGNLSVGLDTWPNLRFFYSFH